MSLNYFTGLSQHPPIGNIGANAAEMQAMRPAQGGDAYRAALDLAAYKQSANRANMMYDHNLQQAQQNKALQGLEGLASQQQADQNMQYSLAGSLLGRLMR